MKRSPARVARANRKAACHIITYFTPATFWSKGDARAGYRFNILFLLIKFASSNKDSGD